jgi:hypothetical protein
MDSARFCPFDKNAFVKTVATLRQEFHNRAQPYRIGVSFSYSPQVLLSLKLFNLEATQILRPFFSTFSHRLSFSL